MDMGEATSDAAPQPQVCMNTYLQQAITKTKVAGHHDSTTVLPIRVVRDNKRVGAAARQSAPPASQYRGSTHALARLLRHRERRPAANSPVGLHSSLLTRRSLSEPALSHIDPTARSLFLCSPRTPCVALWLRFVC